MAFSFGAGSAPAFGAASAPAFSFGGAGATPAFGATSTPAFGATSAPSLFGTASTPSLFGAAAATSPFGGAVATPPFGAGSAPSLFGAAPTPSFGAPGASPYLFGAPASSPSLFGGTPQFGALQQQQQQQPAQQPALQLATKDNRPVTHSTKWEDLSQQAQQDLLALEKIVSRGREECRQLDGEERLQSVPGARSGLEGAARALSQSIATLAARVRADGSDAHAVRSSVMQLLRHTEAALWAFKRTHAWREAARAADGQPLPTHVAEQLGGPVALPSAFLIETVEAFQERLKGHQAAAAELEAVLRQQGGRGGGDPAAALSALQGALANVQDCVMRCAARLQALDDRVAAGKGALLARRRQAGDSSDPFEKAERQERSHAAAAEQLAAKITQQAQQQQQGQGQQQPGIGPFGAAPTPGAPALAPAGLFGTVAPAAAPATGLFGTVPPVAAGASATSRRRTGKR